MKIFIDEGTPISNGIININTINSDINHIIKLLIRNGFVIHDKIKIDEKIKKYYYGYLINKKKIIYSTNYFIKDIVNIICEY